MGAWAGGVATGVTAKNASKDLARANNALTRRMEMGARDYQAQRPIAAEERMRALRQQLGLLNPLNDMTSEITGRPGIDLASAGQSPLLMSPLESQRNPYNADNEIDYAKLGVKKGTKLTYEQARQLLDQKLLGQGYNVPNAATPPAYGPPTMATNGRRK